VKVPVAFFLLQNRRDSVDKFGRYSPLKETSKNVPGKGLFPYANNNVLLPDHAGTPILVALAEEAIVVVGGCGHEVVGFEAVLCRDDTALRDPVCECLCVYMSTQYSQQETSGQAER
jgi:hypothetical protein